MPTAGRLFGGLALALTGFVAGSAVVPLLPTALKGAAILPLVMASFGLLIGWRVIGRFPGKTLTDAAMTGLRAAVYVAIWALVYLGLTEMLRMSTRMRYDTVTEAVLDIFNQGVQFGLMAAHPAVLGALLVGGVVSGIFAYWGQRVWR
jgi:hypothetical protein